MQDSTTAALLHCGLLKIRMRNLLQNHTIPCEMLVRHGVLDLKALSVHLKSFDDDNASEILIRYLNPDLISPGISKRQFVKGLKEWILRDEEKNRVNCSSLKIRRTQSFDGVQ